MLPRLFQRADADRFGERLLRTSRSRCGAHRDQPRLHMRREAVARDHFGQCRLLVGGAHEGDELGGRGAEAHDLKFRQFRLMKGRTAGQRNIPIATP
jgi:hypothetical protein